MVGTVQEADNLFGLVVSKATGILHKIKVGDYIGRDYGRVINITETEIAVEESVPDGQGCYTRKVNTIALYD
jgi:type IV pilus assembly protein PilP